MSPTGSGSGEKDCEARSRRRRVSRGPVWAAYWNKQTFSQQQAGILLLLFSGCKDLLLLASLDLTNCSSWTLSARGFLPTILQLDLTMSRWPAPAMRSMMCQLEMVERSAETCRQQIDLVFVWQIIGPLLPALESRMSRRGGLIIRIVCDNFVFETQEDAEAFLALVKIGGSIFFHRSVVIISIIIIMIFISINLGWSSVDQLAQEVGRLWQRR